MSRTRRLWWHHRPLKTGIQKQNYYFIVCCFQKSARERIRGGREYKKCHNLFNENEMKCTSLLSKSITFNEFWKVLKTHYWIVISGSMDFMDWLLSFKMENVGQLFTYFILIFLRLDLLESYETHKLYAKTYLTSLAWLNCDLKMKYESG
jgi:hypothetical protein